MFIDDYGLFANSELKLQTLVDNFAKAAKNVGLTISIQRSEVMYQLSTGMTAVQQPGHKRYGKLFTKDTVTWSQTVKIKM